MAEWNGQRIDTAMVVSNSDMGFYWIGGITERSTA